MNALVTALKKNNLEEAAALRGQLLLDRSANVNIQDESGNTSLHYAALAGKKDIVKYLPGQRAGATMMNAKEQKALGYATIEGFAK